MCALQLSCLPFLPASPRWTWVTAGKPQAAKGMPVVAERRFFFLVKPLSEPLPFSRSSCASAAAWEPNRSYPQGYLQPGDGDYQCPTNGLALPSGAAQS